MCFNTAADTVANDVRGCVTASFSPQVRIYQTVRDTESDSPVGQTGKVSLQVFLCPRPLNTSQICPGCNKPRQPEGPLGYLHTGEQVSDSSLQVQPAAAERITSDLEK